MYAVPAIAAFATRVRSAYRRHRQIRNLEELSPELRKDIGWPSGEDDLELAIRRFRMRQIRSGRF